MLKDEKIYFAGSIRGGREDVELYFKLIEHLGNYGTVLTEHVGAKNLDSAGEKNMSDQQIHDRDMDWLSSSTSVVAEVTKTSMGVGYELGRMIERTICGWDAGQFCAFTGLKRKKD